MLPIKIIVIIAFTFAWETDTERVRMWPQNYVFFLRLFGSDKDEDALHNSTLGPQHTVYFRPKKMSTSEEGSSLGAIFWSKWELLSKAHKVILAARIPIETDILIH